MCSRGGSLPNTGGVGAEQNQLPSDLTATPAHTSPLILWCLSQPLSKGREGAGISDVWAPLLTTHHLSSPAASSSLQETCCPLTLDRVHSTALGLLLGLWVLQPPHQMSRGRGAHLPGSGQVIQRCTISSRVPQKSITGYTQDSPSYNGSTFQNV